MFICSNDLKSMDITSMLISCMCCCFAFKYGGVAYMKVMSFAFIALSGLTFVCFNETWNLRENVAVVSLWAEANVIVSERMPFNLFAVIKLSV